MSFLEKYELNNIPLTLQVEELEAINSRINNKEREWEDGKKTAGNHAALVKNNLQAIVRRKESDVNNLKQSVEREIKRGKEQQETTKKAIEVLERRLLNAEEQKKVVNQLHKEEVKKREEALKLRRDTQRLLSDEKNKLRKIYLLTNSLKMKSIRIKQKKTIYFLQKISRLCF